MPTITLGGVDPGDVRIDHEVGVDPLTGRVSARVPLDLTDGRDGFGPRLTLRYDSTGAHGPYGVGWALEGLLMVAVSTRRGLPTYDTRDAYTFTISGELVPQLIEQGGEWLPRVHDTSQHTIRYFRGRREAAQIRIEQWTEKATGRVHWRTRDASDVVTVYGRSADARIADPDDDRRVYSWLPEAQYDPDGNAILFDYVVETLDGVDRSTSHERSRRPALGQRYLKRIRYGNSHPLAVDAPEPAGNRWHLQAVLDYGDHDEIAQPTPDRPWPARPDPRSSYRPGFEVRTYRLCRRILQFHEFDALGDAPVLVGAYRLEYRERVIGTTLTAVHYIGHRVDGDSRGLPPLVFEYSQPAVDLTFTPASADATENVPAGFSTGHRWIDLLGEGLPGILTETHDAWWYKANEGGGRFGPQRLVAERPAYQLGDVALADFDADGNPNLAVLHGKTGGYYAYDRDAGAWQGFQPFPALPHLEAAGSRAQWLDVNGDGRAELVVADNERVVWYPSLGADGFGEPLGVSLPGGLVGAVASPPPLAENAGLDFFFADMTGDGLADQVRVRNGRVEYWPHLGNGRFGTPILMADAPVFAPEGQFDASRLILMDLTGDGTADLLYLGEQQVRWWLNANGNSLVEAGQLADVPTIDKVSSVQVLDFLGDGTPCLVWSSPLPDSGGIRYARLAGEVPPNLLLSVDNSMGAQTRLGYTSSGSHYLRDQRAGRPWRTRLPHHHPVADRHEEIDHIGGGRAVTRYEYHDGRYDSDERLTLFCTVDRYDSDVAGAAAPPDLAETAPACTRTWFHPGAVLTGRPHGSYTGDGAAPVLTPHVVERPDTLGSGEYEQALAALAGSVLREEVFAVGAAGRLGAHPLTVSQYSYRIRRLQPGVTPAGGAVTAAARRDAAFLFFVGEELASVYEQDPADPRVAHQLALEVDERGVPVTSCALAYPRRAGAPAGSGVDDSPAQQQLIGTVQRASFRHLDEPDRHELGIPIDSREYALTGVSPGPAAVFGWDELRAAVLPALASAVEFHATPPSGPAARLVAWVRTFYWDDARAVALALGQVGANTLLHHLETASFTPTFVTSVFGTDVDAAMLTGAGYQLRDGYWWRVAETLHHHGPERFFLLDRAVRADGATALIEYDATNLQAVGVVDALGNATRADLDYHVLEPARITDANGNVTEALLDPLGVAVMSTAHGHVRGAGGGSAPYGHQPLAAYTSVAAPTFASVLADPAGHVQDAAQYVFYELEYTPGGAPPRVVELTRERLVYGGDGSAPTPSRIAVGVAHLDGFGRALQSKQLVEPGEAFLRDEDGALVLGPDARPTSGPVEVRWLVSGHTVYNRKLEPIRQYEPFFSVTPEFEAESELATFGAATRMTYDAMTRPVRVDAPNGTFIRTVYNPWSSAQHDANDTVLDSGYRLLREALPPSEPERQAYEKTRAHANTPTVVAVDPAGRAVLRRETAPVGSTDVVTHTLLDTRGAEIGVVDPRGITALTLRRDMDNRVLASESVDAGATRMLPDAYDRPIHSFDGRGVHVRHGFDVLDRPVTVDVDAVALGLSHRTEEFLYGEDASVPDAALRNARGQLVRHRDQAGVVTYQQYSPVGEVLRVERQLRMDYKDEPDYGQQVALEPDVYVSVHSYDALGRLVRQTLPDDSTRRLEYLAGGGLGSLVVSTSDGAVTDLAVFHDVRFNARSERSAITLGNGVTIEHTFDPETFRTNRITARRGATALQDIGYTYDPVGNVVRRLDAAQQVASPIITGLTVTPESSYTYDAFYQLTEATGRVHQALLEHDYRPGVTDTNAMKGTRHLSFNNGAAVERYTRTYAYDLSGNLTQVRHVSASRTWNTALWVSPTSNRSVPANDPAGNPVPDPASAFDQVGNCVALAHLRRVDYAYRNGIQRAVVIDRSGTGQPDDAEYYVYDGAGLRVRKVHERLVSGALEVIEKIYLDGCEIKRIRTGGSVVLHRTTSHLSDATHRVALLHRWAVDHAGRETDDVAAARLRYELADHLGSGELALDETGQVIAYEEYFPFGGSAFVAGDSVREVRLRDYRFCGKESDDATRLYYFGYRYYAPWIGRWMSPDPIGPEDDLNLYRYVSNNPITYTDPMGLQTTGTETQQRGRHIQFQTRQLPRALRGLRLTPQQIEQWNRGEIAIVRRPGTSSPEIMTRQEYERLIRQEIAAGRDVRTADVVGGQPRRPAQRQQPPSEGLGDTEEQGGGRGVTDQGGQGMQGQQPGTGVGEQPGGGEDGDDGSGGQGRGADGNLTDSDGTSGSGNGQSGVNQGQGGSDANGSGTGAGAGGNQGSGAGAGTNGPGNGGGQRAGSGTGTGNTGVGPGGGGERRGAGGQGGQRPGQGAGQAAGQGAGQGVGPGGTAEAGQGEPGGAPGGVPGGQAGGVPGGMVGGEVGGDLNGVAGGEGEVGGEGRTRGTAFPPGNGTNPPPPGQTTNGDDRNGTGAGAPSGVRSGAGSGGQGGGPGAAAGQPDGVGGQGGAAGNGAGGHHGEHPNGPGGQGGQGGADAGADGGADGSGGRGGGRPTGWDRAARVAGYADLQFGDDEGGESGGIPGGMGFLRGRFWQALYIGLTVVSLVGALAKLAGKLSIRAIIAGGRRAFQALAALFTRRFWRAVARRAARYFTRRFWRQAWRRFLRTGVVRFFRDPRTWKSVSAWRRAGRGWPTNWELHHWLFPQRWRRVPQWARNAGFNVVLIPRWLNGYMGRTFAVGSARWFLSRGMENTIRLAIPGSLYGGYRAGRWWAERDDAPAIDSRTPQQAPPQAQPTPATP